MPYLDFNVRGEESNMEVILIGDSVGREASCPKLETCKYAQKGQEFTDNQKFEACGHCHWDYENCMHYRGE